MKKLSVVLVFVLSSLHTVLAQDDVNAGILIDGTLAESFTTWNFKEIKTVVPVDPSWAGKYSHIIVFLRSMNDYNDPVYDKSTFDNSGYDSHKIDAADLSSLSDSKYLAVNMCRDYLDNGGIKKEDHKEFKITHRSLVTASADDASFPSEKRALFFVVKGFKITGYKDEFSSQQNAMIKKPIYESVLLYKSKKVEYPVCICKWPKKEYKKLTDPMKEHALQDWECDACKTVISEPCKVNGKPFPLKMEKVGAEGKLEKVKK